MAQITIGLSPDTLEELKRMARLQVGGIGAPGALARSWIIRMLRERTPDWEPGPIETRGGKRGEEERDQ